MTLQDHSDQDSAEKQVRANRADDIAVRVRSRLWACVVYELMAGARSWDDLDAYWLPEIDRHFPTEDLTTDSRGRRRLFHRIYYSGSNPGVIRGLNGQRLIDVVHADAVFQLAKELYESPFWTLAGKQEIPGALVRPLQLALMERLGLLRLTPTERILARRAGLPKAIHEHRNLGHTKRAALDVAQIGSLDAIALLSCAFCLAKDALSFREADVYLDAIRRAIGAFVRRWRMGEEARTSLVALVERRIVRRTDEPIKPQHFGFWVRKRAKDYDPEWGKDGFMSTDRLRYPAQPESPIVRVDNSLSSFLAAFEDHYSVLRTELLDALRASTAKHQETDDIASSPMGNLTGVEQIRARMIDKFMLDLLNSHDENAVDMLTHIRQFRVGGGLPRMIGDLLDPPRRLKRER